MKPDLTSALLDDGGHRLHLLSRHLQDVVNSVQHNLQRTRNSFRPVNTCLTTAKIALFLGGLGSQKYPCISRGSLHFADCVCGFAAEGEFFPPCSSAFHEAQPLNRWEGSTAVITHT